MPNAPQASTPSTLPSRRNRNLTRPDNPRGSTRPGTALHSVARRRDGIALAATGAIPDRVRAQILDEHRAQLADRQREGIRRRLDAGLLPLRIPYGYRRTDVDGVDTTDTGWPGWTSDNPYLDGHTIGRDGRAPAARWILDPATAHTVRVAASWARAGIPLAAIAARLAADPIHPRPLTSGGRSTAWTLRTVLAVLSEPALTGHGAWGRTHRGQSIPSTEWIVSREATHPAILPPGIWHTTQRAITDLHPASGPAAEQPRWTT